MDNTHLLTDEVLQEGNIDKIVSLIISGGNRVKIKLPKVKKDQLKVGQQFHYIDTDFTPPVPATLTITYRRLDLVFYVTDLCDKESYFQIGSILHNILEPDYWDSQLNSEYYEVVSKAGRTKVKYLPKENSEL